MKISDNTSISMPMKNLISIMAAVAVGVWAYFGVIERLTLIEMRNASLTKDLEHAEEQLTADIEKNNEFRIKYPRGELGQSSQDIEQFMLIEDIYKTIERLQADIDENADNKINIEFMKEQLDKALTNIEKLKDADRDIKYTNGTGGL